MIQPRQLLAEAASARLCPRNEKRAAADIDDENTERLPSPSRIGEMTFVLRMLSALQR